MWISKKKYNELIKQKEDFERIAANAVTQNGRILDRWKEVLEEMKDIQRLDHIIVNRNEELLARCKELEAEKDGLELRIAILNTDYDALDYEHVKVCREAEVCRKERDHYEERCRYLEGEIEDKEELETKLDFAIKQRDYYYDLLENISDGYSEGKAISREAE